MTENEISKIILKKSIEIHRSLGPGQLEKIYHRALYVELIDSGLNVEYEVKIDVMWKGKNLGMATRQI